MRKHMRVAAVVAGAALLVGATIGGSAQAAKKKKGPVVVGTDAADDWGSNVDATIAPVGNQLGQELVEASIEKVDAATLSFNIKVAGLPPSGGVPELTRYVWTMTVDGTLLQLDGKFTNYSRGACDPTAGTCPPPRDPGQAPFMVRGNCTDNGGTAVTCEEIGLVNGTFDAASGTITIPVPLELLGAKPGSVIAHGMQAGSNFAGVWAIPSAWASQGQMPLDEMIITKPYKVTR
ncbi:MAG TPA: hypothetical protein VEV43_07165 [Actinomycetota bacterium]|nr:hypothetical protein [Actinomycetota bacterium]